MLNKRLILWFAIALLGITSPAFSQQRDTRDYKVQQGDTLWDISKKELNDPFLWPKVWKENPDIANPDMLTPGQNVRIPLYLMQQEEKREEEAVATPETPVVKEPAKEALQEEPARVKARPLVDANLYISSGYIARGLSDLGRVAGSPSRRNLFGINDFIYLKTKEPVKVGDRFYIARKREIVHPVNKSRFGDLVQIIGVADVVIIKQGEIIAQILKSYEEIILGDWLMPYTEMTPPVIAEPYRRPNVKAYIVAARNMSLNNAMFDVVYLDKGKTAGLEVGDLLRAISIEKQLEGITPVEHKYPHGIVQVIKVYDTTSVAVIRQSFDPVVPGYLVIQYD